jgi:integrase/recombinase XerD
MKAPPEDTLKGARDRAILDVLLFHGLRREELCALRVKDMQNREGAMHFRIQGTRDKIRYVPVPAAAQRLIETYLNIAGMGLILVAPSSDRCAITTLPRSSTAR